MRVKVLGAAAGGAFPQWNCACPQCTRLRLGTFAGHPRTQAQIAISEEGGRWILLNASPDLRVQIEATQQLWPSGESLDSPIQAAVITSVEADAVVGLLSLREFQPLEIYATASASQILREDNSLFALLNRVPRQVVWKEIRPGADFSIGGLKFQPFSLPGDFPAFVKPERRSQLDAREAVLGLIVETLAGARMAYLPGVARIEDCWRDRLDECDVLFFDGTFWTEDELCRVRGGGKLASQMGHLPLSGASGSIEALRELARPRKIFFHINNTNPILDESSEAFGQVRDAGWEVAHDGMEIEI